MPEEISQSKEQSAISHDGHFNDWYTLWLAKILLDDDIDLHCASYTVVIALNSNVHKQKQFNMQPYIFYSITCSTAIIDLLSIVEIKVLNFYYSFYLGYYVRNFFRKGWVDLRPTDGLKLKEQH